MAKIMVICLTENRKFISPPHQEREIDPSTISADFDGNHWRGKRTGKSIPKLELMRNGYGNDNEITTNEVHQFLSQRVLATNKVRPATDFVTKLSGSLLISEYLYILRPLIYGKSV